MKESVSSINGIPNIVLPNALLNHMADYSPDRIETVHNLKMVTRSRMQALLKTKMSKF